MNLLFMNSLNKNIFFFIYPLNNFLSLNDKLSEIKFKKPSSFGGSSNIITSSLEPNIFLDHIDTLHSITVALVYMVLSLLLLILVLLYLFIQKNYLLNSKLYEYIINYINKNTYLKETTKEWIIKKLNKSIERVNKTNNLFMLFLIVFIIFGIFLILDVLNVFLNITNIKIIK